MSLDTFSEAVRRRLLAADQAQLAIDPLAAIAEIANGVAHELSVEQPADLLLALGEWRGIVRERSAVRYFTVEYEAKGRIYFQHVKARDGLEATRIVMDGNRAAIWSRVKREIDRIEFERLTK